MGCMPNNVRKKNMRTLVNEPRIQTVPAQLFSQPMLKQISISFEYITSKGERYKLLHLQILFKKRNTQGED